MALPVKYQLSQKLNRLVRQPSGDMLKQNDDGSYDATVIYYCAWALLVRLMPKRNISKHPDFNGMKVHNVSAARLSPGIAKITVLYKGLLTGGSPEQEQELAAIEELSRSLSQEPIETHPLFESTLGGTSGTPLNDAKYDETTSVFVGFGSGSAYFGVTSYLAPGATYRRTYITDRRPTSVTVGSIATPTNAPSVSGSYNWLAAGQTWTVQGAVWNVSEEYMLSGPAGWDSNIY